MSDETPTDSNTVNRRRLLKAIGVMGVAGLAGCGGDDGGTPTEPDTPTPTPTEGDNGGAPTESPTPTDTPTPTRTPTPEPTATPGCTLPDDPAPLVSFDTTSDGQLQVAPSAESITATIANPYLFEIQNGEVTLEGPDDWTIGDATGNTFDTLESQSSQNVEWEVSIPSVSGEFELTANVTYSCGEATADVQATSNVLVDPYIATDWQMLATAPEHYDGLTEDMEAPGELPGDHLDESFDFPPIIEVELNLDDWANRQDFRLRFSDYWTSDGYGALLERTQVVADGETTLDVEADTEAELEYIIENQGSLLWSEVGPDDEDGTWRFADTNSHWVYQLPIPEGTSELSVILSIANGFAVEGKPGLER